MSGASRKHCFILRIDPVHMDEYLRVHEELWPEMAIALRDSGYANYSVFADRPGLIVAYVETDDFDAMIAAMQATDVNRRFKRPDRPHVPRRRRAATARDDRAPSLGHGSRRNLGEEHYVSDRIRIAVYGNSVAAAGRLEP